MKEVAFKDVEVYHLRKKRKKRPRMMKLLTLLFIGKTYIASLVALRWNITTKSHTMWHRINIIFLCEL